MKNSFKELENTQITLFTPQREKRVFRKVKSAIGTLRFVGSIVEMFIPVMGDTITAMFGASQKKTPANQSGQVPRNPPQGPDFSTLGPAGR